MQQDDTGLARRRLARTPVEAEGMAAGPFAPSIVYGAATKAALAQWDTDSIPRSPTSPGGQTHPCAERSFSIVYDVQLRWFRHLRCSAMFTNISVMVFWSRKTGPRPRRWH
jgi:hypothetical protein